MEPEQAVFVPAILGVGLLVSLGALARDAIHRLRGRRWLDRRSSLDGREAALLVTPGEEAARHDVEGRRARWLYAVFGIASCTLAVYLFFGSYGNYIGWTGWVRDIGWIWLGYLVAVVGFGLLGIAVGSIAIWWDRPPAWTRPFLVRTPLGHLPPKRPDVIPEEVAPLRLEPGERHTARQWADQVVTVDERGAELARVVAGIWSAVAVVTLSILALQDYLPHSQDPSTIELAVSGPVQIGLLLLFTVGSLTTARHESAGAALMATAAAGLAVLSAIQYPSWVAVGLALLLGTPAFLHWLAWQRDRHVHHILALALASAVGIVAVWTAADALADYTLGPAHPESTIAALPPSEVAWLWAGGTTDTRTSVTARLVEPHAAVRLAYGTDPDLVDVAYTPSLAATEESFEIVRFDLTGLDPDTEYFYAVEADGELDVVRSGRLRTFPTGPASYTIAFASCARSGSNGAVFDAIRAQDPLLYLNLGDLHYANLSDDDVEPFLDAYASALTAPAQSALYRDTSIAYVWDDHDYGGNDADRTSPSREAAQDAYRLVVPHYPLLGRPDGGPIYQTFVAGRVRFVVTDARSEREPNLDAEDPSMLGAEQLAWFEEQVRAAADEDRIVVWVNASPWIESDEPGADGWGGYAGERARIGALIEELGMTDRIVMLSGDAHMVAIDDGTNSGYGIDGAGFPVFHAAALDRPGGSKGGPYSEGTHPGAGQFGTVEVLDDGGDAITLVLTGRSWDDQVLLEHTVEIPVAATVGTG